MSAVIVPTDWNRHWSTLRGSKLLERARIRDIRRAYGRLLEGCALPGAPRFLELGAGSGNASLQLVRARGGSATLVERNESAVAFSKKLWSEAGLGARVTHRVGDLLAHEESGHDVVHSGGVIEHFHGDDRRRVVEAHVRGAGETGRIVILVPVDGPRYRLFRATLQLLGKWIYTDEVAWKRDEVAKAFAPYGFAVKKTVRVHHEMGYLLERA